MSEVQKKKVAPTEKFYKWLTPEGNARYIQGFKWPLPTPSRKGKWVTVRGRIELCRKGIHATYAYTSSIREWGYVGARLFEIELKGNITRGYSKVVARSGRLIREITSPTEFKKLTGWTKR